MAVVGVRDDLVVTCRRISRLGCNRAFIDPDRGVVGANRRLVIKGDASAVLNGLSRIQKGTGLYGKQHEERTKRPAE